ncbi:MAG: Na/Pi cotransporter family protein [Oscillospiraceae bacterium]|nr:Na/Pi cotransporter family protein [Oscillospiraceae bacterium]
MDVFSVITLLGGLAFFLFGMNVMSSSLEKLAGGKLERTIKAMTSNPVKSLALGAIITIAIQSSSATTVMLVGLVNSGIMQLGQTINIILGANIGTTLTAWILSLTGITSDNIFLQLLKPKNFSPIFALVGIIMIMTAKRQRRKDIGMILVGFAVLMYGMTMMSGAMSPLAESPSFSQFTSIFNHPVLAIIISAVFTGIIQSSAASVGILQALAMTGGITYGMAFPLIMGLNIGTCMTALLSSIGVSRDARRVAIINLTIKVVGTIFFLILFYIFKAIIPDVYSMPIGLVAIALGHTVFNMVNMAIHLPFTRQLEALSRKLVPDKVERGELVFLDERLIQTPSIAIANCRDKTLDMAHIARDTIVKALGMFEQYDPKVADEIVENENKTDIYEDKLGSYLVQISAKSLSDRESREVTKLLHMLTDLERIGDHSLNILESAQELHDKDLHFSDEAVKECRLLFSAITEIISISIMSFEQNDTALAMKVEPLEEVIDGLISTIKMRHIERLQSGICTINLGFVLNDMLTNVERVSDHCSNIALCVIETDKGSFDMHAYVENRSTEAGFISDVKYYSDKYDLDSI